ncbi:MAG: flagellar hook-basal body complex protein FliE [Chlamydiales bacterium]|jgi:flagellar hook-basal body complex protein FliE
MVDSSFLEVNSGLPVRASKLQNPSIFVKGADLQINVPQPQESANLENTHTFKDVLSRYLDEVNTLQHDSDAQIQRFVAGETENIHEVVMAMDEAKSAFDLMMQIRGQLVKSFEQISRGS